MKNHDNKFKAIPVSLLLQQELQQSRLNVANQFTLKIIQQRKKEKQVDNFVAYTDQYTEYLNRIWRKTFVHNQKQPQFVIEKTQSQKLNKISQQSEALHNQQNQIKIFVPKISDLVLETVSLKQKNIYDSIINGVFQISQKLPYNELKTHQNIMLIKKVDANEVQKMKNQYRNLKQHLQQVNEDLQQFKEQQNAKDITNSRISSQNLKAQKQYLEFVKKQKKQHEQRMKKLEETQKKKKEKLLNMKYQEQKKIAKQKNIQMERKHEKQKQLKSLRQQQKKYRKQRNSEYIKIKKSTQFAPPIFLKLPQKVNLRYQNQLKQQQKKLKSQRQSLHLGLSKQKIDQHQKKIKQLYEKTNQQRLHRIQQIKQMQKAEVQQSRIKYHSSFSHDFSHKDFHQKVQQQKQKAKQKLQRINTYKQIVKANFKPKVDQHKKKELMNLIQQMDLSGKKVKRTVLKNGNVVFENLNDTDPYTIGIQYLQQVKEMTTKMRKMKKPMEEAHSVDISHDENKKKKNYLQQFKQRSTSRTNQKQKIMANTKFSYEQKLQKVQNLAQKLMQKTRQSQMMLKFGKFKTSQQILNCKDQIDQNYLDIVNMKLELVNRVQDL